MVERILHPQWRDENETSRYPFADSALLTSNTGIVLDNSIFLDAQLYPIGNESNLYLSSIIVDAPYITLNISSDTTDNLCYVKFDAFSTITSGLLKLVDAYSRPAGVLVSNTINLATFRSWDIGTHTFTAEEAAFAASVVIPTPEVGLRGFALDNNDFLANEVWLVGENGVVLREEDGLSGCRVIRMDVVGDPLWRRAECIDQIVTIGGTEYLLFDNTNYLKTINNRAPDKHGNFVIASGDAVSAANALHVTATTAGLKFEIVGPKSGDYSPL